MLVFLFPLFVCVCVCVINFPAHLFWGCNKHCCINLFFPLQSKCCMGTSTITVPPFPWVGEPCHRKLKLPRFDIIFFFFFSFFFFLFFYKAVCSSYLWSSAWDKDSAISAQLAEDFFPKAKACISLTVSSTGFQQLQIFGTLSDCVHWIMQDSFKM